MGLVKVDKVNGTFMMANCLSELTLAITVVVVEQAENTIP